MYSGYAQQPQPGHQPQAQGYQHPGYHDYGQAAALSYHGGQAGQYSSEHQAAPGSAPYGYHGYGSSTPYGGQAEAQPPLPDGPAPPADAPPPLPAEQTYPQPQQQYSQTTHRPQPGPPWQQAPPAAGSGSQHAPVAQPPQQAYHQQQQPYYQQQQQQQPYYQQQQPPQQAYQQQQQPYYQQQGQAQQAYQQQASPAPVSQGYPDQPPLPPDQSQGHEASYPGSGSAHSQPQHNMPQAPYGAPGYYQYPPQPQPQQQYHAGAYGDASYWAQYGYGAGQHSGQGQQYGTAHPYGQQGPVPQYNTQQQQQQQGHQGSLPPHPASRLQPHPAVQQQQQSNAAQHARAATGFSGTVGAQQGAVPEGQQAGTPSSQFHGHVLRPVEPTVQGGQARYLNAPPSASVPATRPHGSTASGTVSNGNIASQAGPGQVRPAATDAAAVKQNIEALRPVVELASLVRGAGRGTRPAYILLVLRGLPGSGKSYLAKRVREVEQEEGGEAPRVHALDEYFVTDVEKEVEEEGPRGRPRKVITTVQEYQYDATMEDAYRRSLVRAVCKTLEEGRFRFVIMDAPNMVNAHWMDVLPACQKHRYQVYVLQPLESDPALCARRNIHGHSEAHVKSMAATWEPPPSLHTITLVDARTLLHGKLQGASHIDEVEMDQEGDNEDTTQANGDISKADTTGPTPSAALSSRWSQGAAGADDTQDAKDSEEGSPKHAKKKARTSHSSLISDQDILQDINSALGPDADKSVLASAGPLVGRSSHVKGGSILKRHTTSAVRRKRVRWCDQPGEGSDADEDAVQVGFRIQPSAKPLALVHVLEGLGPAKGDTALQYMDASSPFLAGRLAGSFADQVKAEHDSEHELLAHLHDYPDEEEESDKE